MRTILPRDKDNPSCGHQDSCLLKASPQERHPRPHTASLRNTPALALSRYGELPPCLPGLGVTVPSIAAPPHPPANSVPSP